MLYITGITGHTGKWLLKRLESENYSGQIRVVLRNNSKVTGEKESLFSNTQLDIELVYGDLGDQKFIDTSLKGVDTVLHIASIPYSPGIIDGAIRNGVSWNILVHTTGRYSKYKSAAENYIRIEEDIIEKRSSGLTNVTILRPTMIYGSSEDRNMYKLVDYLYRHIIFPIFGDGQNLMQPVLAKDLGNAYYDVLVNRPLTINKDYNLSGKRPLSYMEIIRIIEKMLNKKHLLIFIPIKVSIMAAKAYNLLLGNKALINVEQVMRMNEDKCFSHDLAKKDFGYNPVSFEEGISEEVEEYLRTF